MVLFLLVNTVLALCLEAVPAELALRGYAYRTLNQRWRRWTSSAGTLGLFVLLVGASSVVAAVTGRLAGVPVPAPSYAPGGQDPVVYAVLLLFFGAMLQLARVSTGSLWACIAAHLTFLTMNRLVLVPEAFDAGVVTSLRPEAELLVLVYLVLAGIGFVVIGRARGRRIGWRERDPEPCSRGHRAYLRRLEFGADVYARLIHLPAYEVAEVVVDPARGFGQPIFARGGARLEDALALFRAGEPLDVVADRGVRCPARTARGRRAYCNPPSGIAMARDTPKGCLSSSWTAAPAAGGRAPIA